MRLFVAAWPPQPVLDAVAALPRPDVPGVRWTRPDAWHVTLRFLGDLDDPDPVVAALEAAPLAPAVARLGPRVTSFGRRVLMAPVTGLDDLAAEVTTALEGLGPHDEVTPFHGHLTLARARRGASVRPLAGGSVAAEFSVEAVALVCSRQDARGPSYEVVHERRLG